MLPQKENFKEEETYYRNPLTDTFCNNLMGTFCFFTPCLPAKMFLKILYKSPSSFYLYPLKSLALLIYLLPTSSLDDFFFVFLSHSFASCPLNNLGMRCSGTSLGGTLSRTTELGIYPSGAHGQKSSGIFVSSLLNSRRSCSTRSQEDASTFPVV